MEIPKIVVIGSCNIDFSTYVPHLPKPGETLQAEKLVISNGGKGANQCIAAAKLGASTAMIGRLGSDSFSEKYLKHMVEHGVNTDYLTLSCNSPSGTALIIVAGSGENQIVVASGANSEVSPDDVLKASSVIQNAEVVVIQFETPLATAMEVLKLTQQGKSTSIVNAAPGVADLDKGFYKLSDIFCLNEVEAEIMTGSTVKSVNEGKVAVSKFLSWGCKSVVLTMGDKGVVFATAGEPLPTHLPAKQVTAVDTTGAGDAFVGALAYYFAYHRNLSLKEILTRCCEIASVTVQHPGTQSSFPNREQLPEELFSEVEVCLSSLDVEGK